MASTSSLMKIETYLKGEKPFNSVQESYELPLSKELMGRSQSSRELGKERKYIGINLSGQKQPYKYMSRTYRPNEEKNKYADENVITLSQTNSNIVLNSFETRSPLCSINLSSSVKNIPTKLNEEKRVKELTRLSEIVKPGGGYYKVSINLSEPLCSERCKKVEYKGFESKKLERGKEFFESYLNNKQETYVPRQNAFCKQASHKKQSSRQPVLQNVEGILCEEKVYTSLSSFLDLNSLLLVKFISKKFMSQSIKKITKKAIMQRIIQGFDKIEQFSFWNHFVRFRILVSQNHSVYQDLSIKSSDYEKDILKDVDRAFTITQGDLRDELEVKLKKLLVALSHSVKEVGYIQGLNVFVGVFLQNNLSEEQAFLITKYFLNKLSLKEIMKKDFPRLHVLNYQLETYMMNYIPEISSHLENEGLTLIYFTTQWFIPLFAYELSTRTVLKVWNLFMLKGWKVIIRIALGLLSLYKDEILVKNSDQLGYFLRHMKEFSIQEKEEKLIPLSMNFKVTDRLLKNLETLYEVGAPRKIILKNEKHSKSFWEIKSYEHPQTLSMIEYMNEYSYKSCQNIMLKKTPSSILKPLNKTDMNKSAEVKKGDQGFLERLFGFPSKMKDLFKTDNPSNEASSTKLSNKSSTLTRSVTTKDFFKTNSMISNEEQSTKLSDSSELSQLEFSASSRTISAIGNNARNSTFEEEQERKEKAKTLSTNTIFSSQRTDRSHSDFSYDYKISPISKQFSKYSDENVFIPDKTASSDFKEGSTTVKFQTYSTKSNYSYFHQPTNLQRASLNDNTNLKSLTRFV